jgi:cell division protein FtsL
LAAENRTQRLERIYDGALFRLNRISKKKKNKLKKKKRNENKKIGSFSLIERVILSAGAMLIFSVSFH